MLCNICQSDQHFRANCPQNKQPPPTYFAQPEEANHMYCLMTHEIRDPWTGQDPWSNRAQSQPRPSEQTTWYPQQQQPRSYPQQQEPSSSQTPQQPPQQQPPQQQFSTQVPNFTNLFGDRPTETQSGLRPLTVTDVPDELKAIFQRRQKLDAVIAECEILMGMPRRDTLIRHPVPPGKTPLYEHAHCPVRFVQESLSDLQAIRKSELRKTGLPHAQQQRMHAMPEIAPDHEKDLLEFEQLTMTTTAMYKKQKAEKHLVQSNSGYSAPVQQPPPQQFQPHAAAQSQSDDVNRIAAGLTNLQQDSSQRDRSLWNMDQRVQAMDQRVQSIEQKLQILPSLESAMRDSHNTLAAEIQAMNNNLTIAFENVTTRLNHADEKSKQLAASLDKTQRGLLRRRTPQQPNDASPRSDDTQQRSSSLPPSRPRQSLRTMEGLITGQRDTPTSEPPATRDNPFADYDPTKFRVPPRVAKPSANQQAAPTADTSADQEYHDTPIPNLHQDDDDLNLPTTAGPNTALFSEHVVSPPFSTQPSAAPNLNTNHVGSAAGNYVAPSASHETAWLNCEVPHTEQSHAAQVHAFITTSKMPSGKLSMMVDFGAFSNMIGEDFAMTLERRAYDVDLAPSRSYLLRPMTVSGVGNGTNQAIEQVTCPIAVQTTAGKVELHTLRAPVVGGSGKHLPGLLGLQTLEANNAVLDIGNRTLHMLSKGKAQLQLLPGTLSVPLEKSPSGHLVMTIDSYEDIQQQRGGLPQGSINWHAALAKSKAASYQPPPVVSAPQQHSTAESAPAPAQKRHLVNMPASAPTQVQKRQPVNMPASALKKTPSH